MGGAGSGLLSMSAFCGLVALRRYQKLYPHVDVRDAVQAVRRLSADDAHHDYAAATVLHSYLPAGYAVDDVVPLLREAISSVVRHNRPWWIRLASFGRERVKAALSANEAQCFAAAGLFAEIPAEGVLSWWDALAQATRSSDNDRKLQQGREAEQLTIAFERERLAQLGIARDPRWVAIEDNTAGYDVQSYDTGVAGPVNRLIEVKSSSRDVVQIFITRNEWETAVASAKSYLFHVWLLPEKRLLELTVSDIAQHIPVNQGDGTWQDVAVVLR